MGKLHAALRKAEGRRAPRAAPRGAAGVAVADAPKSESAPEAGAAPASVPAAVAPSAPVYVPSALRGEVDAHLVPVADPGSVTAEQYRTLRANLTKLVAGKGWKVFAVASARSGEGRSVTAANLACVLAEQPDRKIVLVDADLRSPSQHRLFTIDNQRGLADYLAGGSMLEMALQRSRLSNLWVLPAGHPPADPAEVLASKRMDDLLARLRRDYDHVVIDTPSLETAPDAAVVAPRADGTLLVVRMARTQREDAKNAVRTLEDAKARVLGSVLTALPAADPE